MENTIDPRQLLSIAQQGMEEEKRAKEEEKARQAAEAAKSRQVAQAQEREEATKDLIASLPADTSVAFQLADSSILESVVRAIACVQDEATFEATEEGLYFSQMDQSHVSLLQVSIPAKACYTYHYQSKSPSVRFTVKVDELLSLAKLLDVSDKLTFVVEGDSMTCTVGPNRTHKIHLYENNASPAPLPKLDFEAKVVIAKTSLQKILRECTIAKEEHVTFTAEGTQVAFSTKSDFGDSEVKLHKFDAEVLDLIVNGRQRATFSTEHIFNILKAIKVADIATVEWSTKKPLKMTLPLANVEYGANAVFWLAPRVSDPEPKKPKPTPEPDEGPRPTPEGSQQANESAPGKQAEQPAPAQPGKPERPKRGNRKPKGSD